jgi:hypothetical protein
MKGVHDLQTSHMKIVESYFHLPSKSFFFPFMSHQLLLFAGKI